MKAISLWQPWASAIAAGIKHIETRHWKTPYRGRLAIHAAKTQRDPETGRKLCDWWQENVAMVPTMAHFERIGVHRWEDLPFGAVVAVCDLVDCVPTERLLQLNQVNGAQAMWGNFAPGRYGWVLKNVVRLDTPIPATGKQALFDWAPGRLAGE